MPIDAPQRVFCSINRSQSGKIENAFAKKWRRERDDRAAHFAARRAKRAVSLLLEMLTRQTKKTLIPLPVLRPLPLLEYMGRPKRAPISPTHWRVAAIYKIEKRIASFEGGLRATGPVCTELSFPTPHTSHSCRPSHTVDCPPVSPTSKYLCKRFPVYFQFAKPNLESSPDNIYLRLICSRVPYCSFQWKSVSPFK